MAEYRVVKSTLVLRQAIDRLLSSSQSGCCGELRSELQRWIEKDPSNISFQLVESVYRQLNTQGTTCTLSERVTLCMDQFMTHCGFDA